MKIWSQVQCLQLIIGMQLQPMELWHCRHQHAHCHQHAHHRRASQQLRVTNLQTVLTALQAAQAPDVDRAVVLSENAIRSFIFQTEECGCHILAAGAMIVKTMHGSVDTTKKPIRLVEHWMRTPIL